MHSATEHTLLTTAVSLKLHITMQAAFARWNHRQAIERCDGNLFSNGVRRNPEFHNARILHLVDRDYSLSLTICLLSGVGTWLMSEDSWCVRLCDTQPPPS